MIPHLIQTRFFPMRSWIKENFTFLNIAPKFIQTGYNINNFPSQYLLYVLTLLPPFSLSLCFPWLLLLVVVCSCYGCCFLLSLLLLWVVVVGKWQKGGTFVGSFGFMVERREISMVWLCFWGFGGWGDCVKNWLCL